MIILLVAVSVVVSFGFVFVILGCFQCFGPGKKSRGFSSFENPNAEVQSCEENTGFSLGPSDPVTVDSSGFTSVTIEPLPDILAKTVSTSALRPRILCLEKAKRESALRLITVHHPFPRAQLTYLKEIGSTWFGQVIESDAEKIITGVPRNRVIVKVLNDNASNVEQKQFLEDVAPFRELDHANVLRLLGQCTDTTPLLLILEFAPLGDLKSYLKSHKTGSCMLTQKHLQLKFALDVASGLACLHAHHYIHHDLAARTCLVAGDQTVKIGDYGTCEYRYKTDYYNNGQELLPLRWMSPESLELQDFTWQLTEVTKECNIWTYGILLWEIMTFGNIPYTALPDDQVLDGVIKQKLIKLQPPDSTLSFKDRIFEVMQFCWLKPEDRPKVEEVHGLLKKLYEQADHMENNEDDFEKKWDSLIPREAQVPKVDNIPVNPQEPPQMDSDFIVSNDAHTLATSNEISSKHPAKLSTTVNGGLDFSPSLPTEGFNNKPNTSTTPFRPTREHLTSTPLSKNQNFDQNAEKDVVTKPVSDFEVAMETPEVSSLNDSALDDNAFENSSKQEINIQTETFVTSGDTATSGVVTGDFSLSGKHSENMIQSSPSSVPDLQIEIQQDTKDNLLKSSMDAKETSNAVEPLSENNSVDLDIDNESSTEDSFHKIDNTTDEIQKEIHTEDANLRTSITNNTTNNNKVDSQSLESFDMISDLKSEDANSLNEQNNHVNTTEYSDPFSEFVDISNHQNLNLDVQNRLTSGDINSTLGADIDEFMNASFDSPMKASDEKSGDSLTDFSELDLILNGKNISDLSSSNEVLEDARTRQIVLEQTPNLSDNAPSNVDATKQVFEPMVVMTTDLDEDLPPLEDMTENTAGVCDIIKLAADVK